MPWTVKKNGSQYCVYKKGASSPIPGGCHDTKKEAEAHKRALYANTEDSAAAAAATAVQMALTINEPATTMPVLVKVPKQPLIEVGMEYPASTGPVTFTSEDLMSALSADMDPTIPRPRVKLGHVDPRFNNSQLFDGEPAFGFIEKGSMYMSEEGHKLFGDYVGVPKWLAGVMHVAYPNRSIEGWFNFEAPSGRQFRFALSAVALLGVAWPAVMQMSDLPLMYGEEMPEFVTVLEGAEA
jgi:hypothetical protein